MVHSFALGGDALNGKVEDGRYFLWKNFRQGTEAPYQEVSRLQYTANYVHGVTIMIFSLPCMIAIWRVVSPTIKQIQAAAAKKQNKS
jgi:hypothetical protein